MVDEDDCDDDVVEDEALRVEVLVEDVATEVVGGLVLVLTFLVDSSVESWLMLRQNCLYLPVSIVPSSPLSPVGLAGAVLAATVAVAVAAAAATIGGLDSSWDKPAGLR